MMDNRMGFNFVFLVFCMYLSTGCTAENAHVGFERLKYIFDESTDIQQVCLIVNGIISSNFSLVVSTQEGIADESDYIPFSRIITIDPGLASSPGLPLLASEDEANPGSPRTCFPVNIMDDFIEEHNETFTINLKEPIAGLRSGISINATSNGTIIKIVDNGKRLNCRSFLRFLHPELFHHCITHKCTYAFSQKWQAVSGTKVPFALGICKSGEAQTKFRRATAPEPGCALKTQWKQECVLTKQEKFERTFRLYRNPTSLTQNPKSSSDHHSSQSPNYHSANSANSASSEGLSHGSENPIETICPSSFPTMCEGMSFAPKVCEERNECSPNHENICQLRTVVFVLDISGSVGEENFNTTIAALKDLVPLFCDDMQLAILTYEHTIKVEFCFDCHDLCSDFQCTDRSRVSMDIEKIKYRGGGKRTHTGVATRCVYDYILDPNRCGVNTSSDCLDIIYITDGQSNGPLKYPQTCNESICLKNHPDWCGHVNTYAIAIGDHVNRDEIACLTQNDEESVFNLNNIKDLKRLVQIAQEKMFYPDLNSPYTCVDHTDANLLDE